MDLTTPALATAARVSLYDFLSAEHETKMSLPPMGSIMPFFPSSYGWYGLDASPPGAASVMAALSDSSHGARSASSSGIPRAIFALFSGGWWSSPSMTTGAGRFL